MVVLFYALAAVFATDHHDLIDVRVVSEYLVKIFADIDRLGLVSELRLSHTSLSDFFAILTAK